MFKTLRIETIAVFAAVVLFILADTLLMFGFIGAFDRLDTSSHQYSEGMAADIIHPSIGRTGFTGREKTGPLTTVDDAAVDALKKQLEETQKNLFRRPD